MLLSLKKAACAAFLLLAGVCAHGEDVGAFLDAYYAAARDAGCATARVTMRTFFRERQTGTHFSGLVSWSGGGEPFLCLTARRGIVEAGGESLFILACRGDELRMADSSRTAYYQEQLSHMGASLLSSRLDVMLCILMQPQLLENCRNLTGEVREEDVDGRAALRLVVGQPQPSMEVLVDAKTRQLLQMVRIVPDSQGVPVRYVMELSGTRVTKRRPPEELFVVNDLFSYPLHRYDPSGLFSLGMAPSFEAQTLDGGTFRLDEQRGRWVVLCFNPAPSGARLPGGLMIERAADRIREAGAVFVDVHPADPGTVYRPQSAIVQPDLFGLYGLGGTGLPCVVVIAPDGRVTDMLSGYIPGLSERAMDRLVETVSGR